MKRLRVAKRDLRMIAIQFIMPIVSLLFGLSLVKSISILSNSNINLELIPSLYTNNHHPILYIPYNNYSNINSNEQFDLIIENIKNSNLTEYNNVETIAINDISSLEEEMVY